MQGTTIEAHVRQVLVQVVGVFLLRGEMLLRPLAWTKLPAVAGVAAFDVVAARVSSPLVSTTAVGSAARRSLPEYLPSILATRHQTFGSRDA